MNRIFFLGIGLCGALKISFTYALVVKTIDELRPLQVTFSDRSFNRIAVESGGIKKIIAPEELFDIQIDEITSQAFISIKENFDQPIAISVITDAGFVQDIEIVANDRPMEMILLKEPRQKERLDVSSPREAAVKILQSLEKGQLPLGYASVHLQSEDQREANNLNLKLTPIRAVEGPFDQVTFYSLVNISTTKIQLREPIFALPGDHWIYLPKESLEPNEQTTLIISRGKE